MGTEITRTDDDRNIIIEATYDKGGRMTALRDPNGNQTTYDYDLMNRRIGMTNPLSQTWETSHGVDANGNSQTVQTMPGVNGSGSYNVTRTNDRAGRLSSIDYGDPSVTPDVEFAYNLAGQRTSMTEYNNASHVAANRVRQTSYDHDAARRLNQVQFAQNTTGDGSTLEQVNTVEYAYDVAGRRTQMTVDPTGANVSITYEYDAKGQLVGMSDWDSNSIKFAYDRAGRHVLTDRANGLRSRYKYDVGGRLRHLIHHKGQATLADFRYDVDKRGNRTRAVETVALTPTIDGIYIPSDDPAVAYTGNWSPNDDYMETSEKGARLQVALYGHGDLTVTLAAGGDFVIYLGNSLWKNFKATAETDIVIPFGPQSPQGEQSGPVVLEIRNKSIATLQFKEIVVFDVECDLHTIDYTYDALSRLTGANYYAGHNTSSTPFRSHSYGYDLAGNLVNKDGITRTYNVANQLIHDGTNTLVYDNNGNLTNDGMNSYSWDHANRMITAPGSTAYAYDGLGNRVQQTVDSVVTDYLNDVQPGLTQAIAATTSTITARYVHGPRGILHNGHDLLQDGLGSVRSVVDSSNPYVVQDIQHYDPYGDPFIQWAGSGNFQYYSTFGFTGEQTDSNGQVYLRARYYDPSKGIFPSLDPFEGTMQRPMSLNGYSWVEGNTPNLTDATGKSAALANRMNSGMCLNSDLMSNCYIVCSLFGCYEVCDGLPAPVPPPYVDDVADAIEDILERIGDAVSDAIRGITGGSGIEDISDIDTASESETDTISDTDTDRLANCRIPDEYTHGTLGVFIHRLIQSFFRVQLGSQHTNVEEPVIEGAAANGSGGPGRPDAVLYPSGNPTSMSFVEIYEIKPISQGPDSTLYEAGKEQLHRYVRNWRYTTGDRGISYAREGRYWNPNGYWMPYPFDTSQELVLYTFYGDAPGMVYYGCRNAGGS